MVVLSSASQKLQRSTKGWTNINISTAGTLPCSFIFPSDKTLICHENLHTPFENPISFLSQMGITIHGIGTIRFARTSLYSRCHCQHHLKTWVIGFASTAIAFKKDLTLHSKSSILAKNSLPSTHWATGAYIFQPVQRATLTATTSNLLHL